MIRSKSKSIIKLKNVLGSSNATQPVYFFTSKNESSPTNDSVETKPETDGSNSVKETNSPNKDINPLNKDTSLSKRESGSIRIDFLKEVLKQRPANPYAYWPTFDKLDMDFLQVHTLLGFDNQIASPFRWTPLIQKRPTSPQFQIMMRKFRKKKHIEPADKKELADTFLFEALRDTEFDYYYDYKCEATKSCQFHGTADFLIYHKKHPYIPFIPVFMAKGYYDKIVMRNVEEFNEAEAIGGLAWALTNMKAANAEVKFARVLHTNGNLWRLFQLQADGGFEKTGYYTPQNDYFNKIYYDEQMQQVVLGLIRFACEVLTQPERELKKILDFVDEQRYLTELDPETKKELERRKSFWAKVLPEFLRKIFFP